MRLDAALFNILCVEATVICRFGRCSNNAAPVSRMPNYVDKNRALSNSATNFKAQPSIYDSGSSGGYNFMQAAQGGLSGRYGNPSFSSGRMGNQQQAYGGGYGRGYQGQYGQMNQMDYGMSQISYPKAASNYAGSAKSPPKLPVFPGLSSNSNLGTMMKAIATTASSPPSTTTTTLTPATSKSSSIDFNAPNFPDSSTGSDFQDQMMQYMQAMQQYMQNYNPQMQFSQQNQPPTNQIAQNRPTSQSNPYGIAPRNGVGSKGPTNIQQIRAQAKKMQQMKRPTRPPTTTTPAPTEKTYADWDCGRDHAGILWCAGERIYEKKEKPKKKAPKKVDSSGRVILSKFAKTASSAKPAAKKPWNAPRPNLGIKKSPVKTKSTGGIFEKGGPIPAGIKTIPILSNQKSDMCRNQGGWGEPCSFDMTVGDACDEKQFWSDNGYTRFIVKCVRSKKRPGFSVRLKMVMTCEWGNCRNGGGSG